MLDKFCFRKFFQLRIREIFDRKTIDSYSVRCHNTLSLIKEMVEACNGWKLGNIKLKETISVIFDELYDSLKVDKCIDLSIAPIDVLKSIYDDFKSIKDAESRYGVRTLQYFMQRLYDQNRECYCSRLKEEIDEFLFSDNQYHDEDFMPKMLEFDRLITSLACEMINRGYSKSYLYFKAKNLCSAKDFETGYNEFVNKALTFNNNKYKVILRLRIENCNDAKAGWPDTFKTDLPNGMYDEYLQTGKKYPTLKPLKGSYKFYIKDDVEALDIDGAILSVQNDVWKDFDYLHIGMNALNVCIVSALVMYEVDGTKYAVDKPRRNNIYDIPYPNDFTNALNIQRVLNNIEVNHTISEESVNRLLSSFRHIRIANESHEIEQQFINYWIALEFLFSSPATNENTFKRTLANIRNILSACSVKRNILVLTEELKRKKILDKDFCPVNMDKAQIESLIGERNLDVLLKYRLFYYKSMLCGHSDKKKEYINAHRKHIEYQIYRMYRLRNELVHEAAIKQNIERITCSLRYYLMFTLNQMIGYFIKMKDISNKPYSIDDFLSEYNIQYNKVFKSDSISDFMKGADITNYLLYIPN